MSISVSSCTSVNLVKTMDSDDKDLLLSLELSLENERNEGLPTFNEPSLEEPAVRSVVYRSPRKDLSVVDEFWEMHDPNPDVHKLFAEFNEAYFYGKLNHVSVCWSTRMTLCAGLCEYERTGGLCTVKLSEPLLKLRPRKDLVETLLHEMIHAYLFVTNSKEHNDHGPEFRKHMNRINKATGANITVFHSFHGEVDSYRTHWWRCNGPCKSRMPLLGFVKRAMNRPPSEKDRWWADHQRKCGGTFTKVCEPESKDSKSKRKDSSLPAKNCAKKPRLTNGADIGTLLVPPHRSTVPVCATQSHQSTDPKNISSFPAIVTKPPSNVHTLSQYSTDQDQRSQVALYTGKDNTLGGYATKSRLLEEDSSRTEHIVVESSCVLGSVSRQLQNTQANEAASDTSAVSTPGNLVNKCVTETEVKPTLQKPSCSSQPTLKDFLGQKTKPAERPSRKSSADKMKLIRELLSSDSESDDECIIIFDTAVEEQGKWDKASTSSSHTVMDIGATGNVSTLVECPVCGHLVDEQFINSHLDACLKHD